MTFVVTGASGSIGGRLVKAIGATGSSVLGVSRKTLAGPCVTVLDYAVETPLEPGDTLVHLAEESNIGRANELGAAHVASVVALVKAFAGRNLGRYVYVSSSAVYDDKIPGRKTRESTHRRTGAYIEAKLAAEEVVREAGGVVVRLANVFGPTPIRGSIFDDIIRQLDQPGPVVVRQMFPVRDYIWLDDAVTGLVAVATGSTAGTFNIGSGEGVSVGDLVRLILSAAKQEDRDVRGDKNGLSEIVLDISTTMESFGWRPQTSLGQGIKLMLRHATTIEL